MADNAVDRPGYSFDPGPPSEAARFLRNKGMRPSFAWHDVEPEEHAVAFTVAKVMELDILEAIRGEVQQALDTGLTFETFQKNFRANPALTQWWGKRDMVDPLTGETVRAQLGSPRRLKTIYRANLASARAAGQWERIERTKTALPYLEYMLGPSEHHRPHHVAKAGTILPVASAFWDEWMPPNGWGCKCWVRQITRAAAERRGISEPPQIRDTVVRNERTGAVAIVPEGIDYGWHRNPGKLRREAMEGMLADRLAKAPEPVQRAALRDIATSWRVERIMAGAAGRAPVAMMPMAAAEAFGAKDRVLWVTSETREHLVDHKREKSDPSRQPYLAYLSTLGDAAQAFMEDSPHGPALHLFLEKLDPIQRPHLKKRGLYVVVWKEDGISRIRTLFETRAEYFAKQMHRGNSIDLKGDRSQEGR